MRLTILTILLTALVVPQAQANISGDSIVATYLFPDILTIYAGPTATVVGPGSELLDFARFVNIDFSANNILITTVRNAGINNVAFDGLDFFDAKPDFQDVTLDPATNYAGFDSSRLFSTANSIFLNFEDLPGLLGQRVSIDIGDSAVPEPSYGVTLAAALLALLFAGNRARLRLLFGRIWHWTFGGSPRTPAV
jgi:hypothetical protein